jgi:hypothetical protein
VNLAELRRRLVGRLDELVSADVEPAESEESAESRDSAVIPRREPPTPPEGPDQSERPSARCELLLAIAADPDESDERREWARGELLVPDALADSVMRAAPPQLSQNRALPPLR